MCVRARLRVALRVAADQSSDSIGFSVNYKEALDNVFVQVVGMLSAEGLITMERVTLDGTKIKANASGNTFRRKKRSKRTWLWRGSKYRR